MPSPSPLSPSQVSLWVFVRPVVAGGVKTRLVPALGEAGAAALYAAFVDDTLATCTGVAEGTVLFCAGDPRHPSLAAAETSLRRQRQPECDLGGRIEHALRQGLRQAECAVAVGSDAPTLPAQYIRLAHQALGQGEVVLGPALDGGYYLIGAHRRARGRLPGLLSDVRWSTRHTLHDTWQACTRADLRVRVLPPWYDVDVPADLRLLRLQLLLAPHQAPATAQVLTDF